MADEAAVEPLPGAAGCPDGGSCSSGGRAAAAICDSPPPERCVAPLPPDPLRDDVHGAATEERVPDVTTGVAPGATTAAATDSAGGTPWRFAAWSAAAGTAAPLAGGVAPGPG
jgi:hypothetical protein